jgi:cell division protein FtsQ
MTKQHEERSNGARRTKKRRTSSGRAARSSSSFASQLAKVGGAITLTGALAFGALSVKKSVAKSDVFRVEKIEISGLARADRESILSLAGLRAGDNLMAVDTNAVERAVARHPWVARVRVERRYPSTLKIEIGEHRPVAILSLGNLYYVDAEGAIVKRHAPGEREALPLITGLEREEVERGDPGALAGVRQAIAFLDEWRSVNGADARPIEEVHVDPVAGLSFVPAGEDLRVHLGPPPWRERLSRLDAVRSALADRGVSATEIALGGPRRPDRATARLARGGSKGRSAGEGRKP